MILSDKTIIITGGSLGIGLAISKKCAQEGATVIIAARNQDDLTNALKELKQISDRPHAWYSLNVGDYDEVKKFADWCKSQNLEINGLVNCAGVYGPIGKTTEIDMQKFTEAIQVNFLGTVYMCNVFAPMLKSNSKKKIVNYSGGGAATPFANYSAYATSKVAIVRFTENLSIELADEHFDINCIAPGFVITRLHEQTIQEGADKAGKAFFEGTQKQMKDGGIPPEKAADLTAFLLSDESDGITGKFISAPWDAWQDKSFQNILRTDKDFATLRRIDNKTFYKQ
jgi:NAD(P)-dependent dehydrogenase (short-subunit alcohol dehydrogenase family)